MPDWFTIKPLLAVVLVIGGCAAGEQADSTPATGQSDRQQIGQVLGKPVYREQLPAGDDERQASALRELFLAPLLKRYRREHRQALEPTEAELEQAAELLSPDQQPQQQQAPTAPGRAVRIWVTRWKLQRHLYREYGGGRMLWQQFGPEAYDATRRWLKQQQAKGAFRIADPELRRLFFRYWTTQDHGPFLTDDRERIERQLLSPPWASQNRSEK
jgi:hypothetical protein